MNEIRQHLLDRHDQARQAADQARDRLARLLDQGEDDLTDAIADLARLQPYAHWWKKVTDNIERGGMEPIAALTAVRTAASQTLIHQRTHRTASLFKHAHAMAHAEATRRFYNDTAVLNLATITGPGPAVPTITTPAVTLLASRCGHAEMPTGHGD